MIELFILDTYTQTSASTRSVVSKDITIKIDAKLVTMQALEFVLDNTYTIAKDLDNLQALVIALDAVHLLQFRGSISTSTSI